MYKFGFIMEYLVSPSMVIESFAGHSSLGWHLCSLRVCMTSAQDLLTFIVFGEKFGVIYTMEYYSAMKNNEFMKFLGKWMELENLTLSEVT